MATTADRLALLQRTKAGQRALLEKMYPDLDFSTVPFREYGRLFTGRKYVPGFVGGWKAYGRSNSEDASTRDILPDYSGNGRDIELHNFAFSDGGTSGWGGGIPMLKFFNSILPNRQIDGFNYGKEKVSQISRNKYKITVSDGEIYLYVAEGETWNAGAHDMPGFIVRVTANTAKVRLNIYSGDNFSTRNIMDLKEGNNIIPSSQVTLSGDTSAGYVTIMRMYVAEGFPSDGVIVEFLPEYPGALVSDGVDDYGQCVKDFALPEDYTIVAVRRRLIGSSVLAGKSRDGNNGAFLFEYSNMVYSYGTGTAVTGNIPALFSYQTKSSYNGVDLNVGDGTDTEKDKLMLFMMRPNADRWSSYALYDLRIYDHSLTAEELKAVKDEMMSDYENATGGGIADIHYVADWDGKGRSNDENEPMRSQWIDKATGKVINLSNFAYAGMSGWNGYAQDFKADWLMNSLYGRIVNDHTASIDKLSNTIQFYKYMQAGETMDMRIRVTGLSRNISEGKDRQMRICSRLQAEPNITVTEDGVYAIHAVYDADDSLYFYIPGTTGEELVTPVTIEQLPLYPGALVFDGVDDYGVTREAVTEQVGTVLAMYRMLSLKDSWHYLLDTRNDTGADRLYIGSNDSTSLWVNATIAGFKPPIWPYDTALNIQSSVGSAAIAAPVMVSGSKVDSLQPENVALYRLILIREQLDDAAVEFLKWKVEKEYRDWCKENGYEYAIDEMLNN